jgi:hypothetical protein
MNFEQGDNRVHKLLQGKVTKLVMPGSSSAPYRASRRQQVNVRRRREALTWTDAVGDHDRGYALDSEGKGHVVVIAQERVLLGSLTADVAQAAGFGSLRDLKQWWKGQGRTWDDNREAWVVTVEPDRAHRPEFMSRPIPGKQGDYTMSRHRAIDEAERVEDAYLADFAKQGRQNHAATEVERLEGELANARDKAREWERTLELAQEHGLDVRSDKRAIDRRIAAIQDKLRQQRSKVA